MRWGLVLMAASGGLWLVIGAWRRGRPDVITQALHGHPLQRRRPDPVDRLLDRWDRSIGGQRRHASLTVLRMPPTQYRRIRLTVAGAVAGASVLLLAVGGPNHWMVAVIAVPGALAVTDLLTGHRADRRREELAAQVVTYAEYLALCTTAGLTAPEAVDRCAGHLPAPLRDWVQDVAADLRTGIPFAQTMDTVAERLAVPAYTRLCDTVLTATEQGTPLGPTLTAQAQDIRDQDRARRMERAGRAEIAMLVPIVFLVLPAVVAVAVYPGFLALSRM